MKGVGRQKCYERDNGPQPVYGPDGRRVVYLQCVQ